MTPAQVTLLLAALPSVVSLAGTVRDLIQTAVDEGYEVDVPTVEKINDLTRALEGLADLAEPEGE